MNPFIGYDPLQLCPWREGRGEGSIGMQAILNVIYERTLKNGSTFADEIFKPAQFTSMSNKKDLEYNLFPKKAVGADYDTWIIAGSLAAATKLGALKNIVGNATLYYNPQGIDRTDKHIIIDGVSIPFPHTWDLDLVDFTVHLGKHYFFKELTHAKLV